MVEPMSAQQVDTTHSITFNDSVKSENIHRKLYSKPRLATILSACLPGLGQAYNGKRSILKIPVIYAGLGGFGYMFYVNNSNFHSYRNALLQSQEANSNHQGFAIVDGRLWSTSQLQTQKIYYKKFRDFSIIGMAAIYLLNIIDANVDAHLKTFDISDDLSVQIAPWQTICKTNGRGVSTFNGLSIKINMR
jgi:predicted transcriptional regulator with HTH domain